METRSLAAAILGMILKVVIVVLVVIWIYRGAMAGYNFGYRVFKQEPMALGEGKTVTVTITEDTNVKRMGELFLQKGLIRDKLLFTAQYYLSEFREGVKPGVYELSTSMTVEEMMEHIAAQNAEEAEEETQ